MVQGVHVLKGNPVLIKTLSCLGRLASLASHSLSAAQGDYNYEQEKSRNILLLNDEITTNVVIKCIMNNVIKGGLIGNVLISLL